MSSKFKATRGIVTAGLTFSALVAASVGGASLLGKSDPEGARETLTDLGFKEIQIHGKAGIFEARGFYRTKFSAVTVRGEAVEGAVAGPTPFLPSAVYILKGPGQKPE